MHEYSALQISCRGTCSKALLKANSRISKEQDTHCIRCRNLLFNCCSSHCCMSAPPTDTLLRLAMSMVDSTLALSVVSLFNVTTTNHLRGAIVVDSALSTGDCRHFCCNIAPDSKLTEYFSSNYYCSLPPPAPAYCSMLIMLLQIVLFLWQCSNNMTIV